MRNNWTSTHIAPTFEGTYLVKTMAYEERFSYFDGRYWRGTYTTAGEAYRMRGSPVVTDLSQWYDWQACGLHVMAA